MRFRLLQLGCELWNYDNGIGGEIDKKKAKYYYELAAMGGHVKARHNLGALEITDGNIDRAFKYVIRSKTKW